MPCKRGQVRDCRAAGRGASRTACRCLVRRVKLRVGDSLREKIDEGLAEADFGIVIVSPAFFTKRWTKRELNGLVAREMAGTRSIVLPVWHEIDYAQVVRHSPPLADVFACNSADGLAAVVEQLLKTIRPVESPLVVAKQQLEALGVATPSVADDWWLDISELKQSHLAAPDTSQRWIFPLPFESERNSHERGANLVSTALQLDCSSRPLKKADRRGSPSM